jgi:cytidylate kinase
MTDSGSAGINGIENRIYTPGMYQKERPSLQGMVENIFDDWKQKRHLSGAEAKKQFPVICFSRRIGVGALEIADILASQIGYRVIDREIMEYLAKRNGADPMFAEFVDGHHIPEMEDILAILFGVKTYAKSEYSRLLFRAIFSFAALGPAIFVGRGAHLILPRERVLAVRLICSDHFRTARVADMLKISESDAFSRLKQLDDDQERFFQNIYGVNEGAPDEYDIIINRDFFQDPAQVAEIVKTAFVQKFGEAHCNAHDESGLEPAKAPENVLIPAV